MSALDGTIDSPNLDFVKFIRRAAEAIKSIQISKYSLGFNLPGTYQSIQGVNLQNLDDSLDLVYRRAYKKVIIGDLPPPVTKI